MTNNRLNHMNHRRKPLNVRIEVGIAWLYKGDDKLTFVQPIELLALLDAALEAPISRSELLILETDTFDIITILGEKLSDSE